MRWLVFLFLLTPAFAEIHRQSVTDPFFDFAHVKSIAFFPTYWTTKGKASGMDPLIEKAIFKALSDLMADRGYRVFYVEPERLEEAGEDVRLRSNGDEVPASPDLIMTASYGEESYTYHVPANSNGGAAITAYAGASSYQASDAYDATAYNNWLRVQLEQPGPGSTRVWFGEASQSRNHPEIVNMIPAFTHLLINENMAFVNNEKKRSDAMKLGAVGAGMVLILITGILIAR